MTKKVKVTLQMLVMCMHHLTVFCAEIFNSQGNITSAPIRLLQRNANNTNYQHTLNSRAVITIYISGYPAPSQYTISKQSGGVTDEFIVTSSKSAIMLESYMIAHRFVLVPEGIITFVVKTITPDSFGNYTLSFHNGIGNNLIYSFKFTEEHSIKGAEVAGGVTAAAVVIVVVLVIVMYFKRKGQKRKQVLTTEFTPSAPAGNTAPSSIENSDYETPYIVTNIIDTGGYDEIDYALQYDRLEQSPAEAAAYENILALRTTTVYDRIDTSQENDELKYTCVTTT